MNHLFHQSFEHLRFRSLTKAPIRSAYKQFTEASNEFVNYKEDF